MSLHVVQQLAVLPGSRLRFGVDLPGPPAGQQFPPGEDPVGGPPQLGARGAGDAVELAVV
ncbi:hypothetical protein QBA54_38055 [Streptomyces sp. B21-108]|uniref:hypothetical protein n=1 Tax=Streptomyces sp. B21-108 TaxID=3039419 RepID=UPI002FF3170A